MGSLKESLQSLVQKVRPGTVFVEKDASGTIHVNLGEVPWYSQAVLIFPPGTDIRTGGVDSITEEGQEYLVSDWSSALDMTIGHLKANGAYFKALDTPLDVHELDDGTPTRRGILGRLRDHT